MSRQKKDIDAFLTIFLIFKGKMTWKQDRHKKEELLDPLAHFPNAP